MDILLRGILIYFVLFILFRLAGKRAVRESTPFGLVLTLLISSSVADCLKNEDRSLTAGLLLAATLMGTHLVFAIVKRNSHVAKRIIDGVPTLLVKNGEVMEKALKESRVNREDILSAGRKSKVTKIEDIEYAVLETDGNINVIPKEE